MARNYLLQIRHRADPRRTASDLPEIVAIYNAAIRAGWQRPIPSPRPSRRVRRGSPMFDPGRRPLWVLTDMPGGPVLGWLSLRSFTGGRLHATVEVGVYVHPGHQRAGVGKALLAHALGAAPPLGNPDPARLHIRAQRALAGAVRGCGFGVWGRLPRVAELDGVERDVLILGLRV